MSLPDQTPDPSEYLVNGEPATDAELKALDGLATKLLQFSNPVVHRAYGRMNLEHNVGMLFETIIENDAEHPESSARLTVVNPDTGEPVFTVTYDHCSQPHETLLDQEVGASGLVSALDILLQHEQLDPDEAALVGSLQASVMTTQAPAEITRKFQDAFEHEGANRTPAFEFIAAMVERRAKVGLTVRELETEDESVNVLMYEPANIDEDIPSDAPRIQVLATDPETNLRYDYSVSFDGDRRLRVCDASDEQGEETVEDMDPEMEDELEDALGELHAPAKADVEALAKILKATWEQINGFAA